MNNIDNIIKSFDSNVKDIFSYVDNNEYITIGLALFLILYASFAAPMLPRSILRLFDNPIVKLLVFFLIVYVARKNVTVAIIAAICVMVTLHALNKLKLDEIMRARIHHETEQYNNQMMTREQNLMPEEMALEEVSVHDENIPEEAVAGLQNQCVRQAKYKTDFYPQYVNMKPDVYQAKSAGMPVSGFDTDAKYASI